MIRIKDVFQLRLDLKSVDTSSWNTHWNLVERHIITVSFYNFINF
jgi:hypothetical protein